jgi:hypothetical protein
MARVRARPAGATSAATSSSRKIDEQRGDARARQLDARFVDFWRDGEIDRPHRTEAQRKLAQ